jgi:phage repressor protein C with HTH and peptisase S24 domain
MSGFFDDGGYPTGGGWDEIPFPEVGDPHAYALEIAGGSMEPVYRDGDLIIVSPQASIRKGDRVVVKTRAGEVTAKMLGRRTINRVELQPFNAVHPEWHLDSNEVLWIARIVWASQ